jgi:Pyruvate phosphate dikinase, PEP/pyruvate binding domain.
MLLSGGGRMEYGEYYKSFDPEPYYRERGWLIGNGKVGGKAKGLSFAHEVLKSNGMLEEVFLPRCTFVITTSVFEEFMEENRLWDRLLDLRGAQRSPLSFTGYARKLSCLRALMKIWNEFLI